MTGLDLAPTIVELVACPVVPQPRGPLREMAFRKDAWTGAEITRLSELFRDDVSLDDIAAALGRGRAGVADRIGVLGLRRNSTRSWSDLEDEELTRRYGVEPTAAIASDFGRSCAAIYARAGLLGLVEAIAAAWTEWEDAQLRAGYAAGVPIAQIATLIGRPLGGISSRAGTLGIVHANHPADWSTEEAARALALAGEGHRYRDIVAMMSAEGFPSRSLAGFGPVVRRLGYGRGWGRPWSPEEDALLRRAYADGASLTPLRTGLGRTNHSIRWRAEYLGLRGTHVCRNGFRAGPDWTEAEIAMLRAEYGTTPNAALAAKLGRTKAAMFTRANLLGLVHGYIRPFSDDESQALEAAYRANIAIADLALALGRKACSVSKYATNHGYRFGRRPRCDGGVSLADLLALSDPPDRAEVLDAAPRVYVAAQQHARTTQRGVVRARCARSRSSFRCRVHARAARRGRRLGSGRRARR